LWERKLHRGDQSMTTNHHLNAGTTSNENGNNNCRLLVVFFEGTANTLSPITTQIGLFADACDAELVSGHQVGDTKMQSNIPSSGPLKMAFDGCGVTNGNLGVLFAAGLDSQCDSVCTVVEAMLNKKSTTTPSSLTKTTVRVVAVGLSRGGIACMKLALKLAKFTKDNVCVSMLLFDPVPGNAVSTGFPYTAGFSQNLQNCNNLERVLAIYPYEPLPDAAMHAPTLAKYPPTTLVEEDVSLGCHQGALFMTNRNPRDQYVAASNLSFRRILDFLTLEGIKFDFQYGVYIPTPQDCIDICRKELQFNGDSPSSRITHDKTGKHRKIVRHYKSEGIIWLNKQHKQLEERLKGGNSQQQESSVNVDPIDHGTLLLDFDHGYAFCGLNSLW